MVGKFHRGGSRAAFSAIDHDEVRRNAGLQHGFHHGKPFPGVADAQLEAGGLAPRQGTQFFYEMHHFNGRGKRAVGCGRYAVHSHWHAARGSNFCRDLGAGKHATVAGLGALAELELDHLHLRVGGICRKFFRVECAVVIAASKVTGGHLPYEVTTVHAVVLRDGSFTGIVRKAAALGPFVERQDGVGT